VGAYAIDQRVEHPSLGRGTVERVTAESVTVLFETAGYKTLDLAIVEEQHLLRHIQQVA
jgi:ATP-dependent DNA helicase RecQ